MNMKISDVGVKLIKSFEGCRLTAYKAVPTEQYWTIGWGHYGADIKQGMTITQKQADEMFLKDIQRYVDYVNNPSYVGSLTFNQNEFDALVSFCYNCGNGNLKKLCLGKTKTEIAKNILLYNKSGGNVLAGLKRRRQTERDLFIKPLLSVADANIITAFLGARWMDAKTQAEKDVLHDVANVARRISGQKET